MSHCWVAYCCGDDFVHPTKARQNSPTAASHLPRVHLPLRDDQDSETDREDKSFSCGHPVWGLAFGPRPPKSAAPRPTKTSAKGSNSLLLATGLENGVIKIWNVLTGEDGTLCCSRLRLQLLLFELLVVFFQVMLCLISMATKAWSGTWSSLRTGHSRSYRLHGIRRWGYGTSLTKVRTLVEVFFFVYFFYLVPNPGQTSLSCICDVIVCSQPSVFTVWSYRNVTQSPCFKCKQGNSRLFTCRM